MPYGRSVHRHVHYENHDKDTTKQTTKATIDKDTPFSYKTQRLHHNDIDRLRQTMTTNRFSF